MMTEDIQKAINANLPSMVGQELNKLLAQSMIDAAEAAKVPQLVKDLADLRADIASFKAREASIAEKEAKLARMEIDFAHKEELTKLRESNAANSIALMRGVVTDVFSNNRFKYSESGRIPVSTGGGPGGPGYVSPYDYNKTAVGES